MSREATQHGADRSARTVKSATAFRTISEVAGEIEVPQHVLRFWETKFNQVRPLKRAGGRRYYRPEDVALLSRIRGLLYEEGYTIKGVQKLLRGGGLKALDLPSTPAETPDSQAGAGEEAGKDSAAAAASPAAGPAPAAPDSAAAPAAPQPQEAAAGAQMRAELRSLRRELALLRDMLRDKKQP